MTDRDSRCPKCWGQGIITRYYEEVTQRGWLCNCPAGEALRAEGYGECEECGKAVSPAEHAETPFDEVLCERHAHAARNDH